MSFKRSLLKRLDTIQQIMDRVDNALTIKTRINISFNKLILIVQSSLAIAIFFAGIEYFSIEPEISIIDLEMSIPEKDRHIEANYNNRKFIDFYDKFNVEIPKAILKDKNLKNFLLTDDIPAKHYILNDSIFMPELESIKNIFSKDSILDEEGKKALASMKLNNGLESQLFRYNYNKQFYTSIRQSTILKNQMEELIKFLKPKLTPVEFYLFVNAMLYSREFTNNFWIKNSGEINLNEILITFYPPVSSLTQKRTGNILEFEIMSELPHRIERNDDKIIVNVPKLESGKIIQLRIDTIENRLTSKDIYYTFKANKKVEKRNYIFIAIIAFIILLIVAKIMDD